MLYYQNKETNHSKNSFGQDNAMVDTKIFQD